jgi:quinol monooxygenase YgiN
VWDGQGNLEEYEATPPEGGTFRGLALRLYDPRARRWSIHWSDSGRGTLDAPMIGEFRDGRGEFYGHEDFDGRRIFSRFLWTPLGPNAARWEQAFSADGGASWETNWVMEFTRVETAPSGGAPAEREGTSDGGEVQASGPAISSEATAESTSTSTSVAEAEADEACCRVLEMRRYTLHPGKRDTLIELFEREFVEAQEEAGMRIVAQFRDLDEPDRFVWLRGFRDVGTRAAALGAFYFGPTWQAHRETANATLVDSDHVRLLRPAGPEWAFRLAGERAPRGATALPGGLVVATVYPLAADAVEGFAEHFAGTIAPRLAAAGATPFAAFETEASRNDFPRLPVREDERVFVWFARFADADAYERHRAALDADPAWTRDVLPGLLGRLAAPAEVMRLTPTARSHPLR